MTVCVCVCVCVCVSERNTERLMSGLCCCRCVILRVIQIFGRRCQEINMFAEFICVCALVCVRVCVCVSVSVCF